MPRVCLTEEQKRKAALKDMCKDLMDKLHAKRGQSRKTKAEFCKDIGVSPVTFWRWDQDEELEAAEFGKVVMAAMRAGLVFKLEEAGK